MSRIQRIRQKIIDRDYYIGNMTCEFCGGQTEKRKVKRQHWLQDKLYIVENVEAEVCPECG